MNFVMTKSEYQTIQDELNSIEVMSAVVAKYNGKNIPIIELMKEYQKSEYFFKYNSFKCNHYLSGYDANNAMEDYFNKLGLTATLNN